MKLTANQIKQFHKTSNVLFKILDVERYKNHGGFELENDDVYNAVKSAIGGHAAGYRT